MEYINWLNKFYFTPKDCLDAFFNYFYKKEILELKEQYDKELEEAKFLIDADGNITFNKEHLEKVLKENITLMNKLRLEKERLDSDK